MLILSIPKYLDELLENGGLTAVASLGELGRVVVMTVNSAVVFVVTILSTKHGWTYGTGEMLNVIFSVQGCDV